MWQIKRKIGAEHPMLEAYDKAFIEEQSERKRQGVKFVPFAPRLVAY